MRKPLTSPKGPKDLLPKVLTAPKFRRCYSAYEHSALHAISPQQSVASSKASQSPSVGLPPDISIETIISVVFICVGLVIGAEELKPISWRVWAGKVERESGRGGPFQGLEDRLSFVDIRVGFPCDQLKRRCTSRSMSICQGYNSLGFVD